MDKERYLQKIPTRFSFELREDFANGLITEEEFECYNIELESELPLEYKYGLYISYLIMRRG